MGLNLQPIQISVLKELRHGFNQVLFWNFLPVTMGNIVGGMVFIGMLFYSTHRTKMGNVLPTVHDEKLERELAAELGAR